MDPAIPFPEDATGEREETLFGGLARRLARMTVGAGLVLFLGSAAPPWVGLIVLVVWFLPVIWQAAMRDLILIGVCALCAAVSVRRFPLVQLRIAGLVVLTAMEEGILVATIAISGGSLF